MILYYGLAIFVFIVGLCGLLIKRSIVSLLIYLVMMISSITLLFGLISLVNKNMFGFIFIAFILVLTVFQMIVGLYITLQLFKKSGSVKLDELNKV